MKLGQKAIDCLLIAETAGRRLNGSWEQRYNAACAKYSEKAVCAKMSELDRRGYIESGVSPRTGWLTDKGREALSAAGV